MVNQLFAGASLLLLASAAQAEPPGPLQREEIVVVGARMSDLEAAVARCEAGGCSVREDVIATVRYAEAQFRNGQYRDARTALGKSVSRTKNDADSDPFAVAELQTARATVAWHYGDQREALRATAASTRLLDQHAPDSPNALMARLRLISAQAHNYGTLHTADRLEVLADDARAAGQPLIAMRADLGRASLLNQINRSKQAIALLQAIMASPVPGSDGLRLAAKIMATRFAATGGDAQAVETLIASLTEEQKKMGPVLLWQPRFPTPDGAPDMPNVAPRVASARSSDVSGLRWVDIGYSIAADGTVDDVEILRGSPRPVWAGPLLKHITQRRFTPSSDLDDMTGRYRVERYTLTADFVIPGQSLIRRRAGVSRFEQMDLTAAPPAPTATPAPTS
jgi:hypothetical protein